jgi:hypothetical protein
MIQAHELRIGNWVIHEGEYKAITGVAFDMVLFEKNPVYFDAYSEQVETVAPIPLTPELLGKAGFTNYFAPAYRNNILIRPNWSLV